MPLHSTKANSRGVLQGKMLYTLPKEAVQIVEVSEVSEPCHLDDGLFDVILVCCQLHEFRANLWWNYLPVTTLRYKESRHMAHFTHKS